MNDHDLRVARREAWGSVPNSVKNCHGMARFYPSQLLALPSVSGSHHRLAALTFGAEVQTVPIRLLLNTRKL